MGDSEDHERLHRLFDDLKSDIKEALKDSEGRMMVRIGEIASDMRTLESGQADLREKYGRSDEKHNNLVEKLSAMQSDIDRAHDKSRHYAEKSADADRDIIGLIEKVNTRIDGIEKPAIADRVKNSIVWWLGPVIGGLAVAFIWSRIMGKATP